MSDDRPAIPERGVGGRNWILGVLTSIYLVNFIDRQILAILLPQVKAEFNLSDTFLGLLVGPTFAFFYATMGLPLALLADRVNRRKLIAASLALFSAMTIACGLVVQVWQLAIARVLTGVGEAGTGPASQTMITDLFPPERRGRAQAIYATGANLGVLVAFAAGGVIAQAWGWRVAFFAAGLPGLLLTVLLLTTVRDPQRGARDQVKPQDDAPPLGAVLAQLWRSRAFRYTALGACSTCFTSYALGSFFPSFLARSHGMSTADIGFTMALIMGACGGLATYAAGHFADRFGRNDPRWYSYIPAIAAFAPLPVAPICFLAQDTGIALAAAIIPLSLTAAFIGPTITIIQRLVPVRSRATAVATLILIDNIVGLGLGPQFVGIASDLWKPAFGEDSLRYALLAAMAGSAVSVFGFVMAARHLRADIAARESAAPAPASNG
ncbi:MFS family permease [Pseudoxanthomonas japonensis]|uniref:spinster family MFS transporter n=1 Tax=Pseudoxanthomonas japonensis TaxID=69284 RepID=UPI002865AF1C|nr:MFS transporter [Pseudoxanthomonas japonensis]MDR7069887.1 MFS family permease [Pseudoxanthomonas japonensis]